MNTKKLVLIAFVAIVSLSSCVKKLPAHVKTRVELLYRKLAEKQLVKAILIN